MSAPPSNVTRLPPGPVPETPLIDSTHTGIAYHDRCKCGQPFTHTDEDGRRYTRCGCRGASS